jgi:formylmethanofuran dehydrogenase subunit E
VDGIQSLTGCTYGKGNLIHLDYGKNAFTFHRRSDGKAIRVATRPEAWGDVLDTEHKELRAKLSAGAATPEDQERFEELHHERSRWILERPLESLFTVTLLENAEIPAKARIHNSVTCAGCGEDVMETRSRIFRGESYCIPCFEARDRRY